MTLGWFFLKNVDIRSASIYYTIFPYSYSVHCEERFEKFIGIVVCALCAKMIYLHKIYMHK